MVLINTKPFNLKDAFLRKSLPPQNPPLNLRGPQQTVANGMLDIMLVYVHELT